MKVMAEISIVESPVGSIMRVIPSLPHYLTASLYHYLTASLHHYLTMPLPHSSSSSSSSTLQISYNVTLSGGASECVSGFGAGDYQYMDATTAFQR
jgi:hypothetical protein